MPKLYSYFSLLSLGFICLANIPIAPLHAAGINPKDGAIIEAYVKDYVEKEFALAKKKGIQKPSEQWPSLLMVINYNDKKLFFRNKELNLITLEPIHEIIHTHKSSFRLGINNLSKKELVDILAKKFNLAELKKHKQFSLSINPVIYLQAKDDESNTLIPLAKREILHIYGGINTRREKGRINYLNNKTTDMLVCTLEIQASTNQENLNLDKKPTWQQALKWSGIIGIPITALAITLYLVIQNKKKKDKKALKASS